MRRLTPLLLSLLALPAFAQSPSRGVRLQFPAVALGDDASSLEVNPGGSGFLRGGDLMIFGSSVTDPVGGSGVGFFAAKPVFFGGFGIGIGLEHVSETTFVRERFSDYTRLTLNTSWAPNPWFSLGVNFHTSFSDQKGPSGLTSWDVGFLVRPSRWLSIGVAVQDLNTPELRDIPLNRAWIGGLAVRPGTDRILLAGDVRIEESNAPGRPARVEPVFRAMFEPLPGVALGGSFEVRERGGEREVLAQLGLSWSFDVGVRGTLAYSSFVGQGGHQGFALQTRLYGVRERATPEPRDRFVKIVLKGSIIEQEPPVPLVSLTGGRPEERWTLGKVVGALRAALRDGRVSGVVLAFDDVSLGVAQAEEIRRRVVALQKAGKKVVAHLRGISNAVYLAASAADRLYVDPTTTFNVVGFASSILFLRGLLDLIGIYPDFIAEGQYKSLPEQFTRKSRSKPARESTLHVLNDVFDRMVAAIAEGRKKDPAAVRRLIDGAPYGPDSTVKEGLADGVEYLDDLPKRLEKDVKWSVRLLGDPGAVTGNVWAARPQVAVVHVEGGIVEGKSSVDPIFGRRNVGAKTVLEALRSARDDPRVKAIVLRVNSPGGSATASDRIWREVMEARKRKPIVASFGNVAASGGYYVAAAAREIFAEPTTVTGSIGILYGKFSAGGLLGKLDVHDDTISIGKRADLLSLARRWTDEERKVLRGLILEFYEQFLDRVVRGRKMKRDDVHAVAQGRIWSGRQALQHKLVDRLGGLEESITRAAELAGYRREEVIAVHLPRPNLLVKLLRRLTGLESEGPVAGQAGAAALRAASSPFWYLTAGEPWAVMPVEMDLR